MNVLCDQLSSGQYVYHDKFKHVRDQLDEMKY